MDTRGELPKGKIILRKRTTKLVENNLHRLESVSIKKKLAQQNYYNEKTGESPLHRDAEMKVPVHARLGEKKKFNRTRSRPQTVDYFWRVKPRKRLLAEGILTRKYRNLFWSNNVPHQYAQQRLERLRESFRNEGKMIFRRRHGSNLTVQVKNPNVMLPLFRHNVPRSLDPSLQDQIRRLQMQCVQHNVIPNMPIYLKESGATSITMNERFTTYV